VWSRSPGPVHAQARGRMASDLPGGATVVLGAQWGDEGKGKLVDLLAQRADVVARCQGGSNAGHTIVVNGTKYALHLLPSGILNPKVLVVIGNGVVVHLPTLFAEIDQLEKQGVPNVSARVCVSDRAHILFDYHQIADGLLETERAGTAGGSIGTTRRGIGPCYADKAYRRNLRIADLREFRGIEFEAHIQSAVEDLRKRFGSAAEQALKHYDIRAEVARYYEYARRLEPMIGDSFTLLYDMLANGQHSILVEGANAAMLDIDFGTYPYVTSSNCTIGGCLTGLGIPLAYIRQVIGVVKAYTTRVGAGPFPTELLDARGIQLQQLGQEYGTTTQRPRRCGWLDTFLLRYTCRLNGFTALCLTKLDVLSCFHEIQIGVQYWYRGKKLQGMPASLRELAECEVEYEQMPGWHEQSLSEIRDFADLPRNAQAYVKRIEELVGVPVRFIGVGPGRDAIIYRD
jgi:adenylosuccinate synthase